MYCICMVEILYNVVLLCISSVVRHLVDSLKLDLVAVFYTIEIGKHNIYFVDCTDLRR